jgi:hypothetical protein
MLIWQHCSNRTSRVIHCPQCPTTTVTLLLAMVLIVCQPKYLENPHSHAMLMWKICALCNSLTTMHLCQLQRNSEEVRLHTKYCDMTPKSRHFRILE